MKKKGKRVQIPDGNIVLFLLDCETTGSRRNYDRAIEWCIMAYDTSGNLLGKFESRVNPGSVSVTYNAYQVHGISTGCLKNEPTFDVVGLKMKTFLLKHLHGRDAGVFVAHNTSTDLQFLECEFIRAKIALPPKIAHGLCTYQTIKRLKTAYSKAADTEWTEVTKTGARCYSVKCCAMFALSKRSPPGSFEVDCGRHHEATADVKAVATILFDHDTFPGSGLWHAIFKKKLLVCQPMSDIHNEMVVKMKQPLVTLLPAPPGWVMGQGDDAEDKLASGSTTLPAGVRPHLAPKFIPPRGTRGPGSPTDLLLRHLGLRQSTRRATSLTNQKLMVELFMFFFTDEILGSIVKHTNAKATEVVSKIVKTNSAGHQWKVEAPGGTPEQRCKNWQHDLTVGELIVWIGIVFKMGAIGHKRVAHYWSKRDGFGVASIRNAMTFKRFSQIASMISFAPIGTESGWAKVAEVDAYLMERCRLAMNITQHMTIDESMLKCLSKYCPWIVYMPRKPIKMGIKVCLCMCIVCMYFAEGTVAHGCLNRYSVWL